MKVTQEKKFKVRYGFENTQYVVVSEGAELEKAVYAWIEQVPVSLKDRMIQGKHIISIEPHYHYYTGWNEFYEPKDGEDWKQIERDCPKFDGVIENTKNHVMQLMQENRKQEIGTGKSLKLLSN